jgi:hypothetical protein
MKPQLATSLIAVALVGCALIEPSAINRFSMKPGTASEIVFACAEKTIRSLKTQQGTWRDDVTALDVFHGLLETGRFNEVNIIGIRTQLKYNPTTGEGTIKIKASGPYFVDLGADPAASKLAMGISQCE